MKYISTRKNNESVDFKTAVLNGLSMNGGLYISEHIPTLPQSFFENINDYDRNEITFQVLRPFVGDSLSTAALRDCIEQTLNFDIPLVPLTDRIHVLELFHGPTKAFKDIGARFLSRCLSYFFKKSQQDVHILVATSGDTGAAVANGFFDIPCVKVTILFPKGKISPYQEYQMTSLGKNIHVLEVDGVFDTCQALVKQAFDDQDLRKKIILSSANSINIARLLPQMLPYYFAYQQLKSADNKGKIIVSVPSGNLGNLTSGILAKKMGLPINKFVASHNENDSFVKYLQTGKYTPKSSVHTYSSAMDVGAPSNFERLQHIYEKDVVAMRNDILATHFDNKSTLQEIKNVYNASGYLLDPHGAVGLLGLRQHIGTETTSTGIFVETAHPSKFAEIIQLINPDYKEVQVDISKGHKQSLPNNYSRLKEWLLSH